MMTLTSLKNLRKLDAHKDLLPIADLIELCFGAHMDADGREYLRILRRAADQRLLVRWIPGCNESVSYPIYGYVWEENAQIIGNLSLIPTFHKSRWYYLIANVAVHPDHRQKGIGRLLTEKALEHIRDHQVHSAWLQVREDNPVAIHIYRSLGMTEQNRRTTWESPFKDNQAEQGTPGINIIRGQPPNTWQSQGKWLQETYPASIAWHLPFFLNRFKPSFWKKVINTINGEQIDHWAVMDGKVPLGFASSHEFRRHSIYIWLALSPIIPDTAVIDLLNEVRKSYPNQKQFLVNYPAGSIREVFIDAGFREQNTLIWMERKFR